MLGLEAANSSSGLLAELAAFGARQFRWTVSFGINN